MAIDPGADSAHKLLPQRDLPVFSAVHATVTQVPCFLPFSFLLFPPWMGKTILITGGARSGKSRIAEERTLSFGRPAVYIATAEAHDDEMATRIAEHQARRGPEWVTYNEPRDLLGALAQVDGEGPCLIDCLTLWLTNLMLADADWEARVSELLPALQAHVDPVVVVTNEVGAGIVPENALARRFRDAAGIVNQRVAAVSDEVVMAVAGYPLNVKPGT